MSTGLVQNRPAVKYVVFINGVLQENVRVVRISQVSGGRQSETATLAYVFDHDTLGGFEARDYVGQTVHILYVEGLKWMHFGRIQANGMQLSEHREELTFTSKFEPWMFGGMIHGMEVYNADQTSPFVLHEPTILNPMVDKKCFGNMGQDSLTGFPYKCFIDPESVRTQAAIDSNNFGTDPERWNLVQAILHFCWRCNPDQIYLRNPTEAEISAGLGYNEDGDPIEYDGELIFDHRISTPAFLPDILDDLLEPYGLSWYLDFGQEGASSVAPNPFDILPTIQFLRRGGRRDSFGNIEVVTFGMQEVGETLDIAETEVLDANLEYSVDTLSNAVLVLGDYVEVEVTLELGFGWDESLDDATEDELQDESTDWDSDPRYRDVWRKFVCNEAGDYIGLRSEFTESNYRQGLSDLNAIFNSVMGSDQWVSGRRKRAYPVLATKEDGTPVGDVEGCTVEWWNGDDEAWHPVSELQGVSCQVLNKELGVYFSGAHVPEEIRRQGAEGARVRITCTIRSDIQYFYNTGTASDSVQPDTIGTIIDAKDRFHFRFIDNNSIYHSDVEGQKLSSNTADDREAISKFALDLQKTFNTATTAGTLTLAGLDRLKIGTASEIRIGTSVAGIVGRDIFLNGRRFDSFSWPQITGITFDYDQQTTTLTLNTLKQQVA